MDQRELTRLLQEKVRITGDGNVVGNDNTVTVHKLSAGDYAIQIGQVVNVTLSLEELQRLLAPAYTPPPRPDPETLPEPGPLPPGSRIPFHRNDLFTGRVAPLKTLARALLYEQSPTTLVTQSIQGMGGVGKTQLAVEVAYRYGRYFHGVHWLNAAQPDLLRAEVAACGAAMSLPSWPEKQPEQIARTLHEWKQGSPRLIILDNLEQVDAAREWLAQLSGGPLRLLLTARRTDWPADLGLSPLPLGLFSPGESRAFLRRYLPDGRATDADLHALAGRLGHLPLALELAGRYLARRRRLTVAAYLEKVETILTHPSMQDWRAELGNPTGHDLCLMTTFTVSWGQVTDVIARRLFSLAGHCAPNEPIPFELLQKAAEVDEGTFDEALDTLTGLSLLQMEPASKGPIIHPLLAEYAKSRVSEALPALAEALATATSQANRTGLPDHFRPLRPHVERVAAAAEHAKLEHAGVLWNNLGYHLWIVADYEGSRDAFQQALTIDERVYGPNHPNVARDVNNLGVLLQALGDLEGARKAFQRALYTDEEVYGPDHPNVAIRVNNLGGVLKDQGNPEEARDAFQRALAIDEQAYGSDHPYVARDVNNLGIVLQELGELARAQEAFQRALAINEQAFGPNHPEVAKVVNNLGLVLRTLGNLKDARAAYERALAIHKQAFGHNHPNVATIQNNLGLVLQDLGELKEALEAIQQALVIDERVYGPNHPEVATDLNNLGNVLLALGDLEKAREAFERALAIDERIYSPDHPKVAIRVNNYGGALQTIGDLEGARDAFQRALTIDERVYGPNHPNVARDVNNLGGVMKALGDLEGARDAFQRALTIDERVFGPDHLNLATDLNNLGTVHQDLGELDGAREALERALRILEGALPSEHHHVRIARENLERLTQKE